MAAFEFEKWRREFHELLTRHVARGVVQDGRGGHLPQLRGVEAVGAGEPERQVGNADDVGEARFSNQVPYPLGVMAYRVGRGYAFQ